MSAQLEQSLVGRASAMLNLAMADNRPLWPSCAVNYGSGQFRRGSQIFEDTPRPARPAQFSRNIDFVWEFGLEMPMLSI
jgi:hypothetical protein